MNRVTTEAGKVGRNQRPPEFAISADGSKLAICGLKKMEVYDVKTDKLQASHEPKIPLPAALKFGPDGKMLAAWRLPSPQPSPVLVWEFGVTDAAPKPLEADPWAGSSCITFSPDGKTLAVGYLDGTTLLWDLTAKDAK